MLSEPLTKMLILQDREMKLQQVESQLSSLPAERAACRAKIDELSARVEASRHALKEIETKAKGLEVEMKSVEAQVIKYKQQQVLVKKNDEYQALIHEIDAAQERISALESQELELLYELDEARETQKREEKEIRAAIESEERQLQRLEEKEASLKGEIDGARLAQGEAEAALDRPSLSRYRQAGRGMKLPIVVELIDQKCGGCHMRVSSSVNAEARISKEIIACDNCGRILYWDS